MVGFYVATTKKCDLLSTCMRNLGNGSIMKMSNLVSTIVIGKNTEWIVLLHINPYMYNKLHTTNRQEIPNGPFPHTILAGHKCSPQWGRISHWSQRCFEVDICSQVLAAYHYTEQTHDIYIMYTL